jgi:HK97 family phage portal protein
VIADRLGALFARPQGRGDVRQPDPSRFLQYIPTTAFSSGVSFTEEEALQLSVVWGCIDAITKAIASCRWKVFEVDGARREHRPNDPVDYLLNTRPNPETSAIAFRESLLYQALPYGNAYAEIERAPNGRVAALWPLLSNRMVPRRDPETLALYYEYYNVDGGRTILQPSQVFHLRGPSINGLLGDNLIARAASTIGLAIAAERFSSTYFGNNTIVGAVLEYPKTLDDKTYERLKQDWEEKRAGPDKAHKPLILEGGMKFEQLTTEPEKAQLVDSRKFQVEEICRWFGVPPHKVQHLDRATFNNIEHLGIEFVRDAVTPWALRLQQEADFKLFAPRAPWRESKLDVAWLSFGDAKSRAEAQQIWRRVGAFSANDILEMEGRNTIGPEGDIRIVEANMQRLELVGTTPAAAVTPTAPASARPEPAAPGDDEAEPGSDDGTPGAALLREAVVVLLTSAMDRYAKRLSNRAADLRRRGVNEEKIAANLADERIRLRTGFLEECLPGVTIALKAAGHQGVTPDQEAQVLLVADAIDAGRSPADAAARLVEGLVAGARAS